MIASEWWETFDGAREQLRALVAEYHPTARVTHLAQIDAPAAELACAEIRAQIANDAKRPGLEVFDAAADARNADKLRQVLDETWFGLPESMSSRALPGFGELCDLCEGIDDEEGDGDGQHANA